MAISDPSQIASNQAIRERVLRSIALNRNPGLHFPGHFLGVTWQTVSSNSTVMTIADGPHCRNADGSLNLSALALLVDSALATIARCNSAPGAQIATLRMLLEFTGIPLIYPVTAEAKLLGHTSGDALHQLTCSAILRSRGEIVAYAGGTLAALDPPSGISLTTLPWEHSAPIETQSADESTLKPQEIAILKACDAALAQVSPQESFIQHFWGNVPKTNADGASQRLTIGPHITNRAGHAYGGIMTGIAAANACAAAPPTMRLSSISVWFISPGKGKALNIRSRTLHAGRNTSVVRTEVKPWEGVWVLEAVSQHSARR